MKVGLGECTGPVRSHELSAKKNFQLAEFLHAAFRRQGAYERSLLVRRPRRDTNSFLMIIEHHVSRRGFNYYGRHSIELSRGIMSDPSACRRCVNVQCIGERITMPPASGLSDLKYLLNAVIFLMVTISRAGTEASSTDYSFAAELWATATVS